MARSKQLDGALTDDALLALGWHKTVVSSLSSSARYRPSKRAALRPCRVGRCTGDLVQIVWLPKTGVPQFETVDASLVEPRPQRNIAF